MSVVIRMQRAGGRNAPFFRVVVADSRRARDGRFLEKLGYYNPLGKPFTVQIDAERVRYWMGNGATPSESVAALLKKINFTAAPAVAGAAQPAAPVAAAAPAAPAAPPEATEAGPTA